MLENENPVTDQSADSQSAEVVPDSERTARPAESAQGPSAPVESQEVRKQSASGKAKRATISGRVRIANWAYALIFIVCDTLAVSILQWGVSQTAGRVELANQLIGLQGFIAAMWTDHRFVFVLNLLALGLVYAMLLFVFNRFWVASTVFLSLATVIAVIEHFKVAARYETVLPSDFNFLQADAGNIMSFLPAGSALIIIGAVIVVVLLVLVCVVLTISDRTHGTVVRTGNKGLGASLRIGGVVVPTVVLALFMTSVGTYGTWSNSFARWMGDTPSMWDSVYDAQYNGAFVSFSRQLNPKVMDKPSDYSQASMKDLVKRYSRQAEQMNKTRYGYLNESTVLYILSESFSDPTRVPGIELNQDPMPHIRSIKQDTTSGLMLSSGYGGGTANMEFQALSGLSMANFDSSLTSPYQQVIPDLHWMPMVNQNWGPAKNSQAFHPYESSMYSRAHNYKTFGFSHFYALAGKDVIAHQDKIDNAPYVSDQAAYQSALEEMQGTKDNQFVEVITMQNHMPYKDWYNDNPFEVSVPQGQPDLGEDEETSVRTYAKGVSLTDQATKSLLDSLDKLNKPVTVLFYGDHLPGIYNTASTDPNNSLDLHLTDYFIWSNKASASRAVTLGDSSYTSPNFFNAQVAEHMGAKLSPYLAFLTALKSKVSAMEPPVVNKIQGWERIPDGQTIYLDSTGKPMDARSFDKTTKQLLHDYQLIQYDIMAGKQYLKGTSFMKAPTRAGDMQALRKAEAARAKHDQAISEQQASGGNSSGK